MNDVDFWDVEDPFVVVTGNGFQVPLLAAFPQTGSIVVARLSGIDLENDDNVYLAFYGAFSFPEYFGWNWDALSDCLRDLSWCPASRYLVLIDHAEKILADDEEGRKVFFSILQRAAREWATPMLSLRPDVVPFKVVLLSGEEHLARLRDEIQASKLS